MVSKELIDKMKQHYSEARHLAKEMWIICWEDKFGERLWEVVSGQDAMQIRVDEIVKSGILSENIIIGEKK